MNSGNADFGNFQALSGGVQSLIVSYEGSHQFQPCAAEVMYTIYPTDSSCSLMANVPASIYGQPVTFNAEVLASEAVRHYIVPTGTVTFLDGDREMGAAPLDPNAHAVFTVASVPVGEHAITARYDGDLNLKSSRSAPSTLTVQRGPSWTFLFAWPNPADFGVPVTLTAVAWGPGQCTGTVTFIDDITTLGTGVLDAQEQTTFVTDNLSMGTHPIVAVYAGDSNHLDSLSAPLDVVISEARGDIRLDLTSLAFPSHDIDEGPIAANLPIFNDGSGPLAFIQETVTITGPASGEFAVPVSLTGVTIPPGGSAEIPIAFDPLLLNERPATLEIHTNDADEPVVTIALSGQGHQTTPELVNNLLGVTPPTVFLEQVDVNGDGVFDSADLVANVNRGH